MTIAKGQSFTAYNMDCVQGLREHVADNSIGYSIFSPPFASLYTFSDSAYDMSNVASYEDFFTQFSYLVRELQRVMMPGRNLSFHCTQLTTTKQSDGFIGLRDFRGDLLRCFVDNGFIYHSETTIWKDPVVAMQRTKAIGLLHKQVKKDSALSRMGLADYLVTVRKNGDNQQPITKTAESFPVNTWSQYASPVWMDINPSDTLQYRSAREHDDERHISPLQLQVIERGIELWSNPNDLVLSPFMGIGSEGYTALRMGRRFVGFELKESYFKQARMNLANAEVQQSIPFDFGEVA